MLRVALRGCVVSTFVATQCCKTTQCEEKRLGDFVGNTPLIYLRSMSEATGCKIYGKAEFMNPTGSVKDRAAMAIIEDAESSGTLVPGGTIVEGTGGNTGIALAQLGIARGYKVVLCMPESIAKEKIDYMRQLGAEVHLQPGVPFSDPRHYAKLAETIATQRSSALHTNQFENLANFRSHLSGTGPEIWAQTNHKVDIFVAAAGTGGTLAGVSSFLKTVRPGAQCYLADCSGSSLFHFVRSGGLSMEALPGSTIMEGIGINRITANFKEAQLDGAVSVSDQEAVDMAYSLLRKEGLFVGPSAALNVAAAVKLALQHRNSGKVIVTILCDGGGRYASKLYDGDWLQRNGLTSETHCISGNESEAGICDDVP